MPRRDLELCLREYYHLYNRGNNRNHIFYERANYLFLNPVMAGLVERPKDWEFSSYRECIGLRNGTLPNSEVVLDQFSSRAAYREFVDAYVPAEREMMASLLFD